MNKDKKKYSTKTKIIMAVIVLVVIALIAVAVGYGIKKYRDKQDQKILNSVSKEIYKDTMINNFSISNIKLEYKKGIFTYTAELVNKGEKTEYLDGIAIEFYKGKKEVGEIKFFQKQMVDPGEKVKLTNYSDVDYTKADSFKYVLVSE